MKEKRTITVNELLQMNVSSVERKDNNPRGVKTVSVSEIKPGDEVVLDNYFHLVLE